MCRSYHTGRGHPACDAVLRHALVASLDGTLHRHLHALEQSPAYFFRSKWPRIGSGNFALTELIASSTCRRSAVSLPVFRNCISSRTNSSKPSKIVSTFSIRHNFNIFGRERRAWITKQRRCSQRKWLRTTPADQHCHTSRLKLNSRPNAKRRLAFSGCQA